MFVIRKEVGRWHNLREVRVLWRRFFVRRMHIATRQAKITPPAKRKLPLTRRKLPPIRCQHLETSAPLPQSPRQNENLTRKIHKSYVEDLKIIGVRFGNGTRKIGLLPREIGCTYARDRIARSLHYINAYIRSNYVYQISSCETKKSSQTNRTS